MAWNLPKAPPPPPGTWEHWSYGAGIQGWTLRCGALFHADVRRVGDNGQYYGILNCWPMGKDADPQILMARIEDEIVRRASGLREPYTVIHARVKARYAAAAEPVRDDSRPAREGARPR